MRKYASSFNVGKDRMAVCNQTDGQGVMWYE